MKVDIAICTWNRAPLLARTLQRLCEITIPSDVVLQCLVINNNCTDSTPAVLETFSGRLPLRHLHEPCQGQVHARNRAAQAATGELLLWIDDDVLVSNDWLSSYVRAAQNHPDVSFWGGPIIPHFESSKPAWIEQNWEMVKGCFACRDLGADEFELTEQRLPYGANFGIRLAVQRTYPFQPGLGRTGRRVLGEDELDLFRRLLADGYVGRWLPDARVQHWIDAPRATTRFVSQYFVGQGHALVARKQAWTDDVSALEREAARERFWYRCKRWWSPSRVWLSHLIRSSLALGQAQAQRQPRPQIERQPMA